MEAPLTTGGPEGPGTVIVGAGLSGLVIARELVARGGAVTVVDRNLEVGGLARTFRRGGWSFDIGPHRLRSEEWDVRRVIQAALGGDVLAAPAGGGVHAFGRTHPRGPRSAMLRALPLGAMLRGLRDFVRPEVGDEDTYESEIVATYGRTVFEALFRRATERLLRAPAERIDADWARLGISGTERKEWSGGLYPRRGIGTLADALASDVLDAGGRILLDHEVRGIELEGDRVVSVLAGEQRLAADAVVWTAPITLALRLLDVAPPTGLRFVSTVLYNVALREPHRLGHPSVCYAGEESFVRVSDPAAFSPMAVPPGKAGLCVECSCREGDDLWEDPSRHVTSILVGLADQGAISSVRSVEAVWPERVADTYPVYERGYREELRGALASLARYRNFTLAGRAGLFWYNRMDQAIGHGLRVAARLDEERTRQEAGSGGGETQAS
jgi:protoporphyrinogen oxidase